MTVGGQGRSEFDYDVAVSFAGEDRKFVHEFVRELRRRGGVRVFYDQDETAEMWGANLVEYLHDVYRSRARFALLFVSRHYLAKKWTNHERRSAQDRALSEAVSYILPVKLDDSTLPGLHEAVGYVDARKVGVTGLVSLVVQKLSASPAGTAAFRGVEFDGRVPRTHDGIELLLRSRPEAWEYLLFAAILHDGDAYLADKYRDHDVGYSGDQQPMWVDRGAFASFIRHRMAEVERIIDFLGRLFDPSVQEAAFGAPGHAGDPGRLIHAARRICTVQANLLDWAAALRSTRVETAAMGDVVEKLARFADQPINAIRIFIRNYVNEADTFTERLAVGERIKFDLTVTLDIPPPVLSSFQHALRRYERT